MEIVQKTPMRLILQEQSLGLRLLAWTTAIAGFWIMISAKPPTFLWGAVLITVANLIASWSPQTTFTFDKINNQLLVHRQRCCSQHSKRHAIHHITAVHLHPRTFMGQTFYQVSLSLASGVKLPITQSASTDLPARMALAEQIRTFLGHRPSRSTPLNPGNSDENNHRFVVPDAGQS